LNYFVIFLYQYMLRVRDTCINFSDEILSGAIQDQIKREDKAE
jgi:hypothetical protein